MQAADTVRLPDPVSLFPADAEDKATGTRQTQADSIAAGLADEPVVPRALKFSSRGSG